jgi:hypothetical protein
MQGCHYLYLHGFGSSPQSTKAQYLQHNFAERGYRLALIDLNQGGFSQLTLTRMLAQVSAALPSDRPTTLIGSSLGGLVAAWIGEKGATINQLVLLAPAFGFLQHWLDRIPTEQLQQWQQTGSMSVYHYGEGRSLPLDYGFVEDAARYDESLLQQPIPTLILHGHHDEVIPVQASRDYAADRPWVTLIELDSDHALTNVLPTLSQAIAQFCAQS